MVVVAWLGVERWVCGVVGVGLRCVVCVRTVCVHRWT